MFHPFDTFDAHVMDYVQVFVNRSSCMYPMTSRHTAGYTMPLLIVRLILISKAMNFAYKAIKFT